MELASTPEAAMVTEAPPPAPARAPRVARAPKAKAAAAEAKANAEYVDVSPRHPELFARLKPVLNRGADLSKASDGFRNGQEFATVAHAAQNTQVPFMLLKHRVLNEKMSLASAILASHPDANAAAEVAKARSEAQSDLAAITL